MPLSGTNAIRFLPHFCGKVRHGTSRAGRRDEMKLSVIQMASKPAVGWAFFAFSAATLAFSVIATAASAF